MPIRTHISVHVKVVEQNKLTRELMVIGRDFLVEERKRAVSIALAEIAKNLIISSILFDDINNVFDGRRLTGLARNRVARRTSRIVEFFVSIRRILQNR